MNTLYAHCIEGGFTFGMDAVTPVTFEFSNRQRKRRVYRSFKVEKPSKKQVEYARSHHRVFLTLQQLRATMAALQ